MSDISQRDHLDISHFSNIMQQKEKKDNEVTDSVPTSSFNLFFTEQQSTSSRTPQSGTVILLYRNKRNIRASIFYRNRCSDPSVGVEYCSFSSHHVSHDMGAVESDMVLIILDMGCSSLYFVLHCCFDVFEFVHFCGLYTCTLDTGCCVLNCYFSHVEFDYHVYNLSFQSNSCQRLLSTNPFTVDLTKDGDVETNPGPRKRRSDFKSTPPSKIIRNAIF
ncbi:hypothetical protein P9112_003022 [Eukaryota sp. TZLM1-RC]